MEILRKILLFVCVLKFPFFILSQDKQNVDSFIQQLVSVEQDTVRIELFIKLSSELAKEDSILKFAYADSALLLSENINNPKYLALAKKNKAKLFQFYNKYTEAIAFYESAINLFKETGDNSEISDISLQLGDIYYILNDFQKSTNFHLKALEIRTFIKDTTKIIQSEKNVAVMYWRMGNLADAEKHYLKSLDLADKINDTNSISTSLNSLGAIHWGYGKFNTAFEYFKKAQDIAIVTGNNNNYVLVVNNIGLIYKEWGKYEKAMESYQQGLKTAKKEDYLYGLAYSYSNIGKIYLLENEHKKALLNFDSALINYVKISKKIGIAFSYCNTGDAYLGMKNLDKAIQYYKLSVKTATEVDSKQHLAQALYSLANAYFESQSYTLASKESKLSLDISINQNYQDIIKDNYFLLSKISEISGMHSNALFYYKKASEIKDSIFNKENSIHFAEMQTRYETEKKERENIMLRKEEQLKNIQLKANKIEIQNQYILILAFATLLLILGVFAILLFKSRKDLLKSKALLTKQNKEINVQKEELFTQRENLKEINILLHDNSQALKVKKDELQGTISKLKKAIGYKHKIFSIIAHDLRGPIGTISSIISLVLDNQLSEEKRKKLLSTTKESTVATYTLLENLLIWANNEQGKINFKPQSLILVGIIESNIDLLKETANTKSLEITFKTETETEIFADYNTVDTIFRNLISNAIKFSKQNGIIQILIKEMPDFVEISVIDAGVGMSANVLKNVLDTDKYFTDPGTYGEKGSGLGLQLCFEFIKMNKGNYRIESKEGEGTNFIFTLPVEKNKVL